MKVLPSTHLTTDLDADELDRLEIAMTLEEQFGIEIPGAVKRWQTAGDILDSVQARLEEARPPQLDLTRAPALYANAIMLLREGNTRRRLLPC